MKVSADGGDKNVRHSPQASGNRVLLHFNLNRKLCFAYEFSSNNAEGVTLTGPCGQAAARAPFCLAFPFLWPLASRSNYSSL